MVTHKQLEEAKQYVNYGIKEGYLNESEWEDLTDEEFVLKRQKLDMYGDPDDDYGNR